MTNGKRRSLGKVYQIARYAYNSIVLQFNNLSTSFEWQPCNNLMKWLLLVIKLCKFDCRVKMKKKDVQMTMMKNKMVSLYRMVISVMMKVTKMMRKIPWNMMVVEVRSSRRYCVCHAAFVNC
jgi:hypothetical protein